MRIRIMRTVIAIFLSGLADALDTPRLWSRLKKNKTASTNAHHKFAFAFAPGGLLFPYYLGAAYQLQDLGLLKDTTPIGGTSAGSIVATAIAFGKTEAEIRASMAQFMKDVRSGDELKTAFRRQLDLLVPENAPELAKKHGLAIGYYEVYPHPGPHIVTSWKSKEDFIQTVLASCNFPFYFSRAPFVRCRDSWAIDGMFAVEDSRFGCPHLPGERTVAVVGPFVTNVNVTGFDSSNVIQPGLDGMSLPENVDAMQWLQWSLLPASDEGLEQMIALGKAHVRRWAVQEKLMPGFIEWAPPWRNHNVQPAINSKIKKQSQAKFPIPERLMPPWGPQMVPKPVGVAAMPRWSTGTQFLRRQPKQSLFPQPFVPISLTALDKLSAPDTCLVALAASTFIVFVFRSRSFTARSEPLLVA